MLPGLFLSLSLSLSVDQQCSSLTNPSMRDDRVLFAVSLLVVMVTVVTAMTAELKVLRSDTVFRSLYLETFGEWEVGGGW